MSMDAILKADIFFFITAIAVIIITPLLVMILVYTLRILRRFDEVSEEIRKEALFISADVDEFRRKIKDKASNISGLLGAITAVGFLKKLIGRRRR